MKVYSEYITIIILFLDYQNSKRKNYHYNKQFEEKKAPSNYQDPVSDNSEDFFKK